MEPYKVSLVIVGEWNKRIFSPNWIKAQLLDLAPEAKIEVNVNLENLDVTYSHEGVSLNVRDSVLELTTDSYNPKRGKQIGVVCNKIIHLFPQTPVRALGVNVRFELTDEIIQTNRLVKAFRDSWDTKINGFLPYEQKYSLVSNSKEYDTNLIYTHYQDENGSLNVNFHYAQGLDLSESIVSEHVIEAKKILENEN